MEAPRNPSSQDPSSSTNRDHSTQNTEPPSSSNKQQSPSQEKNSIGIDQFIKIGIVGNVDSGKSTLVGVLSKGELDDGRGSARLKVFNYPHEVSNGRTSSVGHEIMGFCTKTEKQVFPQRFVQNKNK